MKKLFRIIPTVLLLTLTACGSNTPSESSPEKPTDSADKISDSSSEADNVPLLAKIILRKQLH
ncbi:hypothetical protein [Clostridium sp. AM58-1XD]|uniref:hypothetical protein n=1 Tax=Clostridium sp. AM58-1XD TaxID=2292307 RepID=UPI000E5361D7|nr:hypothetical protein [Clostridium sp. AM58-1XD]RGY95583.1 hypothetical protein DXA13_18935 [Clostridium sp. AM58-1XD]